MTEDEMVGWHHRLNGHDFEQALTDNEGQRNLVGYSSWGWKESDTTEQLHFTCSFTLLPKLINIQTHLSLPSPLGGKHLLLLLSC